MKPLRHTLLTLRLLCVTTLLLAPALQAQIPNTLLHSIPPPSVVVQSEAGLGYSVAVNDTYTITGVPTDDTGGQDSGVVKVFNSSTGALLFVLPNPSPATGDWFGSAVALSGSRIIVGATGHDTGGLINVGIAYVYDLTTATPTVPTASDLSV